MANHIPTKTSFKKGHKGIGNLFKKGHGYIGGGIKKGTPNVKNRGENNGQWKGGVSYEPYSVDWTKTLKKSIRERDHYICQICGKEPAISVHHIDYNKKNCNTDNLITLCNSCHIKTNTNRDYWINYFK